jgi:basic membrane lipoprotein Med (substrate-binding protein (PBP1-ABC) superfamily)
MAYQQSQRHQRHAAGWRGFSLRRRVMAGGATAVVAVLVGALLAWLSMQRDPAPRASEYLTSFTACLLTDSRGIAAAEPALIWRGMQNASLATRAKVEYLPVMSGSTAAAAAPYLASLVERHCNVVLATGKAQVAVVKAQASRFPLVHFVIPGRAPAGSHVTGLPVPPASLASAVASVISADVRDSS